MVVIPLPVSVRSFHVVGHFGCGPTIDREGVADDGQKGDQAGPHGVCSCLYGLLSSGGDVDADMLVLGALGVVMGGRAMMVVRY